MSKKPNYMNFAVQIALVVAFAVALFFFVKNTLFVTSDETATVQTASSAETSESSIDLSTLPEGVSSSDWELILVNRDNRKEEFNPELSTVEGIEVDARIEQNVIDFLAAAREIDSTEHLISGYRSVSYQEQLFNGYVQQEMEAANLTEEEAIEVTQTYSQPAGASEHQTGLAIDMSTVDALNQSATEVVAQIKAIAPEYGFVLRFEEDKTEFTGVGYEDWHFRYVGVESAKFMTENNLSLEEYVALLQEDNR